MAARSSRRGTTRPPRLIRTACDNHDLPGTGSTEESRSRRIYGSGRLTMPHSAGTTFGMRVKPTGNFAGTFLRSSCVARVVHALPERGSSGSCRGTCLSRTGSLSWQVGRTCPSRRGCRQNRSRHECSRVSGSGERPEVQHLRYPRRSFIPIMRSAARSISFLCPDVEIRMGPRVPMLPRTPRS